MKPARLEALIVIVCLSFFGAMCMLSARGQSLTMDETVYMSVGAFMVEKHVFDYNPEQPPVPKLLAGLANIGVKKSIPKPFEVGQFLRENRDNLQRMAMRARAMIAMLGVIACLFVYLFSRRLFGRAGGLFSLACCCLCPNLLANAGLITGDLPAACFCAGTLFFVARLWERFRWIDMIAAAALFAAGMGSKFTLVLVPVVMPLFGMMAGSDGRETENATTEGSAGRASRSWIGLRLCGFSRGLCLAALLVLGSLPFIWMLYGCEIGTVSRAIEEPEVKALIRDLASSKAGLAATLAGQVLVAGSFHIPSPSFISGLLKTFAIRGDMPAYLAGRISYTGWWHYYLAVIALKTPIAFLAVWIAALFSAVLRQPRLKDPEILCLCFALLMTVVMSASPKQLGLRYVLPIYPLLFVISGRVLSRPSTEGSGASGMRWPKKAAAAALLIWGLGTNLSAFPHYLTYLNEYAGDRKLGVLWVADSNLDWGQDLIGLKRYMDRAKIPSVKFSYFGNVNPEYYGVNYEYLYSPSFVRKREADLFPRCLPVDGYVAISATNLAGEFIDPHDCYAWVRKYEPIEVVGNTIFVYYIPPQKPGAGKVGG